MRRGQCFLCHRRDSQALRLAGVRFFYMINYTQTGRCTRRYFCSDCENNRTPEIEAEYHLSEQIREDNITAKRNKILNFKKE